MRCACCDRSPCICHFCEVCKDHLRHDNNDVYCVFCAEELQVTVDGKQRIITFSVHVPIDLPLKDQIRASVSIRGAADAIAAVYQVNKETT